MKFLLISSAISNDSNRHALVESLGKPITESSALVIPTAWYAYPGGLAGVYQTIVPPLCRPFFKRTKKYLTQTKRYGSWSLLGLSASLLISAFSIEEHSNQTVCPKSGHEPS